ncbi:SRPBCC family protein [Flexivirga sp.]|uniref:SRPBCC family protein n=1 Tax=Flexivirga sp. TaxID=1962927 RepID=UPI003F7DBACC
MSITPRPDRITARPVSRTIDAPAAVVWEVLSNGWSYAAWVVGSARIRAVDAGWPQDRARLYHSVGLWPVMIHDHTDAVSSVPGRELVLAPRAWPWGRSEVRLTLEDRGDTCVVGMAEDVISGPGLALPRAARQLMLRPRNRECLRRLALIAERNGA